MSTGTYTGITWRAWHKALTAAGCTFHSQTGSHIQGQSALGRSFGTCDPAKPGYVSWGHVRQTAQDGFGLNAHDLLIQLGLASPGKSKQTAKRASRATRNTAPSVERVPEIADLALRLRANADSLYRSHEARYANMTQRRALADDVRKIEAWMRSQGVAV